VAKNCSTVKRAHARRAIKVLRQFGGRRSHLQLSLNLEELRTVMPQFVNGVANVLQREMR